MIKTLFWDEMEERYRALLASGVPAIRAYERAFSEAIETTFGDPERTPLLQPQSQEQQP